MCGAKCLMHTSGVEISMMSLQPRVILYRDWEMQETWLSALKSNLKRIYLFILRLSLYINRLTICVNAKAFILPPVYFGLYSCTCAGSKFFSVFRFPPDIESGSDREV